MKRTEIEELLKDKRFSEWSKSGSIVLLDLVTKDMIEISKGYGDNLLPEDYEAGYDAYLNIQVWEYDCPGFTEKDGGMVMYKSSECDLSEDLCSAVERAVAEVEVKDFMAIALYD